MRTIPECRDVLLKLADDIERDNGDPGAWTAGQIRQIVADMHRRKPVRKTRAKLPRLTPQMAAAIRAYAAATPDASQLEIALVYGVNPGRVSEALAGTRDEAV